MQIDRAVDSIRRHCPDLPIRPFGGMMGMVNSTRSSQEEAFLVQTRWRLVFLLRSPFCNGSNRASRCQFPTLSTTIWMLPLVPSSWAM